MNILFLLTILLSLSLAQSAELNQRTLVKDAVIPLVVDGRLLGSMKLPAGSVVTVVKEEGDNLLVSRGNEEPFKIGKEAFVIDSKGSNPILSITVDHPVLSLTTNPAEVPNTKLSVTPLNFPTDAQLTYSWKQIQDVLSPIAAKMDQGKVIEFGDTNSPTTIASFTSWGVYEIKVTVTDTKNNISISRNTWVNVWDSHSHIVVNGKEDSLCMAPGITPPTGVRTLSPDPGPFCHPRLFTTDREWAEVSKRTQEGIIAGNGLKRLQTNLSEGIDSATSDYGRLTAQLEAYADSNYQGPAPDLTMGMKPDVKDGKPDWSSVVQHLNGGHDSDSYFGQLRDASFAAWLKVDTSIPHYKVTPEDQVRFRKLAKVVAAVSHLYLANCWDKNTGVFKTEYPLYITGLDQIGASFKEFELLALAYDFTASWMTPGEQKETRNFLFAVSAGRTTGARDFFDKSNEIALGRGIEHGVQQNGDFMNIEEEKVLSAMVIEGEEKAVDPKIMETFTSIPKPKDYETSGKCYAYDWMQPVAFDSGRNHEASKPYPEGGNWPNVRKVGVDNLQRMIWWNDDWYVSPWGFEMNREAYYGYSAFGLWPTAVAYARHGAFNMYVGSNFYHTTLHQLYSLYPGELPRTSPHFNSNYYLYDHHDGGEDSRQTHLLLLKYMYPDDPAVDFVYSSVASFFEKNQQDSFNSALFGLDPGIHGKTTTLPEMAKEKALPLTKVDPQVGLVATRSGWNDDDSLLYFDEGWSQLGHMHAEKNSFAFYALGRAWAISPGYHMALNNAQSTVMIQDPAWAKDPATEGYIGESPSLIPKGSSYPSSFPTPPGHLLEVTESPDKSFTLMAGDAKAAYDFNYNNDGRGAKPIIAPWTRQEYMYPGTLQEIYSRVSNSLTVEYFTTPHNNIGWDHLISVGYNPVKYAFRSILFVRGKHPYMLVVDDINKDGTPRNYRWMMNCSFAFGSPDGRFADAQHKPVVGSMIMAPGSTAAEATLLHLMDQGDQPGLPRLLIRDVSGLPTQTQPAMTINTQDCGTEHDHTIPTDRLFIDRRGVIEPKYKLLFYPYRTGEKLPTTTWNKEQTQLTVKLPDGTVDIISFDNSNRDHRTRIAFKRSDAS